MQEYNQIIGKDLAQYQQQMDAVVTLVDESTGMQRSPPPGFRPAASSRTDEGAGNGLRLHESAR
jgi:hypothetical protein